MTIKITVSYSVPLGDSDVNANTSVSLDSASVSTQHLSVSVSESDIIYGGKIMLNQSSVMLSYSMFSNSYSATYSYSKDNATYKVSVSVKGEDTFAKRDLCYSQSFKRKAEHRLEAAAIVAVGIAVAASCGGGGRMLEIAR